MSLSLKRYTPQSTWNKGLNRLLKERNEKEKEMSVRMATKIGDILHEEVVIEILSWLPVKTLLQFKCACKSWYVIITSSKFIAKHLKNHYNHSGRDCLLAQYSITQAGELELYELLVDEKVPRIISYELLDDTPTHNPYICGPCDGIYYLYDSYPGKRALWNPAIDELKVLPPIITKSNVPTNLTYYPWHIDSYGFGLDPVAKDYKVIIIKRYWNKTDEDFETRYPLSVFEYSLRTDSWRYWGDLAKYYDLHNNKCYIFVNGVFYWLGSYVLHGNPVLIVSFDMANDMFQEIKIPNSDKSASKSLAVYHDCIALLIVHEIEKLFDMWILNEGCWAKKFSLGSIDLRFWKPVGSWKNDRLILASDSNELFLCDPSTQEVRDLGFRSSGRCEGVVVYKESLFSLKDTKRVWAS